MSAPPSPNLASPNLASPNLASPAGWADLRAALTPQAVVTGLLTAAVGYGSSFAVLLQGLSAMGAEVPVLASALLVLALAKGVPAIVLSLRLRMPISIAWSTPGAALLASSGMVAGGFAGAVGAFLIVAALVALAALWTPLARAVARIPRPIASAMLAGVLLHLCLAPFTALAEAPALALPVVGVWAVVARFSRLYAVPAAVAVALALMLATGEGTPLAAGAWLPVPVLVAPVFSWEAATGLALPLFLVTMASQNVPGLAVLGSFGYHPPARPLFLWTAGASALVAPLGGLTVNLAAITAALCAGPDAGPDPARRYGAAVVAGVGYILLGALAGLAAAAFAGAPPVLLQAVAGLALLGAFGGALLGAVEVEETRVPALVTFLTAASGFAFLGIGPAFWGLLAGLALHGLHRRRG